MVRRGPRDDHVSGRIFSRYLIQCAVRLCSVTVKKIKIDPALQRRRPISSSILARCWKRLRSPGRTHTEVRRENLAVVVVAAPRRRLSIEHFSIAIIKRPVRRHLLATDAAVTSYITGDFVFFFLSIDGRPAGDFLGGFRVHFISVFNWVSIVIWALI